jgi:uncharacterized protein (DUF58 family)
LISWWRKQRPAPPETPSKASGANAEQILQRVEWTILRRLDGILHGDYRSLLRGFGLDLADLREYQSSDDVRFIDWNVTARMNTPYVREFEEDRDMCAWFFLDLSASMDFGSTTISKRMLASELVACLTRVFTRHGNPAGALLYSQQEQAANFIRPRQGRQQALLMIERIHAVRTNKSAAAQQVTNLAGLLDAGRQLLRRRSMVFIVSDFIAEPGWESAVQLLARSHEVVAVRVQDPLEVELPDIGNVQLEDPETGELLWVNTSDRSLRARFAEQARVRQEQLDQTFHRLGMDCLTLTAGQEMAQELVRFCQLRRLRRRRA